MNRPSMNKCVDMRCISNVLDYVVFRLRVNLTINEMTTIVLALVDIILYFSQVSGIEKKALKKLEEDMSASGR